ncbi:L10-interacting MYB domain-containing protein [Medicago truncatula]|nr:L10-interacting MYB domain-containing protein-like [Medicago truncatula]
MAKQKKVSADWSDLKVNEIFIQTCLDQVVKNERVGTSFTKKGWKNIVCQFHESTGRDYDKIQLKNRYDALKKEWRVWFNLFGKVTGMGWDNERNTFDAPDEWWENKQLENPLYGKFREKGLPFANQLTTLFKDVVANGEHAWAPSSGILPNEDCGTDVGQDVNNIDLDVGEGSGEDVSIGAT